MTLTVLLIITARVSLSAQTSGERGDFAFSRTETTVPDDDRIRGLDRWAFRINALELLCTVPNINIEFDLSSSPFNRWSLGLGHGMKSFKQGMKDADKEIQEIKKEIDTTPEEIKDADKK